MTFLAPAWLLLLALAGLVLLLHARRRQRVDFPSIQIWRLIEQSTNRRRSLRRPPISLLLLLQLLIIAALAVALAQPRFGVGANDAEHVVLLLDSSASMQAAESGETRFDAARGFVTELLDERDDDAGGRVSVVAVEATPRIVIARQTVRAGMMPILDGLAASDGAADWSRIGSAIAPLLRTDESLRIVVLSDDADGAAETIAAALPEAEIERASFGSASPNLALDANVQQGEDGEWTIAGTVRFVGGEPEPTEITLLFRQSADDRFLDFGSIAIAPPDEDEVDEEGDPSVISFETTITFPGPGALQLALPEDAGPHDNVARFILDETARRAQVLIVGAGEAHLNRAIAAIDDIDIFRSDTLPSNVSEFDLIVVDDVEVDRQPETNVLWLERGRVSGETEPPVLADAYFVAWDKTHPLSANVDWGNIALPRAFDMPPVDGAETVVTAASAPIVQARTTPFGREIVVALSATASGWIDDPGFPAFIANVIGWLDIDLGTASPTPCVAGAVCPIEARLLGEAIAGPDGAMVRGTSASRDWLPDGLDRTFVPGRAGFYRIGSDEAAVDVAVNAASGESDLTLLGGSGEVRPFAAAAVNPAWWLLLLVLALLIAETWIAGRGSERFLMPRALARETPFARQRRWHLGLRLAAIAVVIAGLFSLPVPVTEPARDTVAIVTADLGDDISDPRRTEVVNAADTLAEGEGGSVGLFTTGAPGVVTIDIGDAEVVAMDPAPGENLEEAVMVAAAMLRGDRPGRIILAAGGNQTDGNLAAAIAAVTVRDIPVDVYPTGVVPSGEVLVHGVSMPATVFAGDSFTLNAFLFAESATEATVTLLRNGEILSEQTVSLAAGDNRIEATVMAPEAGEHLYEVAVAAGSDVVAANNRDGVVALVEGPPAILIVADDPEWGAFFADALGVQDLSADVVAPDRAPFYIDDWLQYDLVVLMNVPAIDLTTRQQDLIADYVEIHGRGLLILGGEHAFGPGGYYQTALERISPLSARVPQDAPGAALMFVLDRSGSMQAMIEDVNRLEIAKEATLNAVSLLHEESQVGVIVFDEDPHEIVPMQERKDEAAIAAALRPIEPGGGTRLHPALSAAIDALAAVDAQAKHIVVMTDGLIEPVDFLELLSVAAEEGITISTVAIGSGADVRRAEEIARLGGGASHATQDFRALPSILSQEAMMLSGTPVEVRTAPVFWVDRDADFLAGLPEELPPLENYVETTLRPSATLHLATLGEDDELTPIMASWRYGNGLVLALATHGAGSGTQNWLTLPQYPLMWAQIARHFAAAGDAPGLAATARRIGDAISIDVAALDPEGLPLTGQDITVTPAAATGAPVRLSETAPGLYAAAIPAPAVGTNAFEISMGEETATTAVHVGYPAIYDFTRADADLLAAFAAATGGSVLVGDPLAGVGEGHWVLAPDWWPWALIALVLFLADLVVRYAPGLIQLPRRRVDRDLAIGAAA